jgi:DNA invertase Pin-like site-specific DNA recombinase
MFVGYARTSTFDQVAGLEAQVRQLTATGCTKLFKEQVSSVAERAQLDLALDFVREGDALCITRMDRLARSTSDLLSIVGLLEDKGVSLHILDFGGQAVDTRSPTGRLIITVLAALAELERSLMLDRQRAGIERAKRLGKYQGRQPTARRVLPEMRKLAAEGLRPPEIAARLRVSRASVYRLLKEDRS